MTTALAINELITALVVRLTVLTAGLTFAVDGSATKIPIHIHGYRLPQTAMDDKVPHVYPYLIVRPLGGSDGLQSGLQKVMILAGIYNPDPDQGEADLEALQAAVLRISEEQNFHPYALVPGITWQNGEERTGAQDPPAYYFSADLQFMREPLYLTT